jgi:NADH:ubiquinone oxidoreductase subunit B-like Fe-S oxidoreductase
MRRKTTKKSKQPSSLRVVVMCAGEDDPLIFDVHAAGSEPTAERVRRAMRAFQESFTSKRAPSQKSGTLLYLP